MANSTSNTYAGATTVYEGTLLLSATGSVNAAQNLTFATTSGTIAGGTFTLTFNGATTTNITYTTAGTSFSSLVANIQSALNALSTIQPNNTVVAFSSLNGTNPILTVTFVNQLGGQSVAKMSATSSLSGGTAPTLQAPTVKTAGVDVVAVPNTLTIGSGFGGSGVNKVDVVRETGNNEIASSAEVFVNNSGLLDLNNHLQTLSNSVPPEALVLVGGTVTTGTSGTLTLGGNVADQTNAANETGATISGNLSLGLAQPPRRGLSMSRRGRLRCSMRRVRPLRT